MLLSWKSQFLQVSGVGTVTVAVNAPMSGPPVLFIDHCPGLMKLDGSPAGRLGIPGTKPDNREAPCCATIALYPEPVVAGRSCVLLFGPVRVSLVPVFR